MPDALFLDDSDRYSRLRLIGWWDQERLTASKVLVVGAGAIGNEVLKNLALIGIGHVWVIDCDAIEDSNLTRSILFRAADRGHSKAMAAAAAMHGINPDVRVTPLHGNVLTDVGLGLFRDADLVIGALDNREARLWVNRSCWKVGTPWIDGGIQEISGVVKVFVPPDGACYECGMTDNDYRLINLRYSCPLLKREDLLAGKVPTAPTVASMIGALQVQEALKLLHGLPVAAGQALVWNGVANHFYKTAFQRREGCLSHETYAEPIELPLSARNASASELLDAAASYFDGCRELALALDRDLVTAFECACGRSWPVMKPRPLADAGEARCEHCGEEARPRLVSTIAAADPLSREPLAALGIPPYDIVRVASGDQEQPFLLAGDVATTDREPRSKKLAD
jgi:adenylyltransferase/sulfurtransferase